MFKSYVIGCSLLGLTLQAGNTLACLKATEADAVHGVVQAEQAALPEIESFGQAALPVIESGAKVLANYAATQALESLLKNGNVQKFESRTHIKAVRNADGSYVFSFFGAELGTLPASGDIKTVVSQLAQQIAASSQTAGTIASSSAASSSSAAPSSAAASSSQS
jgi:hypothetical protein